MATWARYLRKVNVSYCPFAETSTPAAWLAAVTTKTVSLASPKLEVSKTLLSRAGNPEPTSQLSFADGSSQTFKLESMQVRDIIEEIELCNVRIAQLETERGRPFS